MANSLPPCQPLTASNHTWVDLLGELQGELQYGNQELCIDEEKEGLKHLLSEFQPEITASNSRSKHHALPFH
jgi:hypothetical protein